MLTLTRRDNPQDGEDPVYTQPTAPQTIGGVLDDAVSLYRNCLPRSWPLALAPEVAVTLTNIHIESKLPPHVSADPMAALAMLRTGDFVFSALFSFVVLLLFNVALTDHMHAQATGRPASTGRSLGVGLRLLPRAIGAWVVLAVAPALGALLRLVPGLYVAGALMLTFVAMIVGDLGVLQSIAESYRLVKGHWWRTVTIYSVATVIAVVFYVVLVLVTGIAAMSSPSASALTVGLRRLVGVAIGTLMTLWFPAVLLSLYYDLNLRRASAAMPPAGGASTG